MTDCTFQYNSELVCKIDKDEIMHNAFKVVFSYT